MNELYQNILIQSDDERDILDWLFELKERGLIHLIERAPEIKLSSGLVNEYIKRTTKFNKVKKINVTKEEPKKQTIISPHYYTSEFVVYWHPSAVDVGIISSLATMNFAHLSGVLIGHPVVGNDLPLFKTFIEVKPDFDYQNMTMRFMINQILAWEKRGVYINLLKPKKLFKSTFTPQLYLKTRKKKTEREIKWDIISCDEYLKSIGYESNVRTGISGTSD